MIQSEDGYRLGARLRIHRPGTIVEVADAITDAAHGICPCSKATRDNIDVVIDIV